MLKTRVIPTLLFKDHGLVKGKKFNSNRGVGSVIPAVKIYNLREVDELIFLDVDITNSKKNLNLDIVREIAQVSFVPLTVGGGVKNLNDIEDLLKNGADKVSINTEAFKNPKLIKEAAKVFGSQCITVSVDFCKNVENDPIVWINSGQVNTNFSLYNWIKKVEDLGAGELLITSIDNDGTFQGYQTDIYKEIVKMVRVPVIASGGAGKLSDFVDVVQNGNVSAVAAASLFHFTEMTPMDVKNNMKKNNINIRVS